MSFIAKRDLGFLAYWAINSVWRQFPPVFRHRHALTIARPIARLWLALSPTEQKQTIYNLELMLNGQSSSRDLLQISLTLHEAAVWSFLAADVIPQLSQAQIREISEVRGLEHVETARARGRGVVLLSAHYGSHGYQILAALQAYGCPVTAVAGEEGVAVNQEQPDRSWLYLKLVHPMRSAPRSSLPILTRGLVPDRQMAAVLQRNEVLWMQGDMHLTEQEAAQEYFALPVPFLWGKAVVRSGPIRLPKMFGATVLPSFAVRQGSRLIVEIEEPLPLQPGSSREDIIADLQAFLERLERRVLAAPEQWIFTRHENLTKWIKK